MYLIASVLRRLPSLAITTILDLHVHTLRTRTRTRTFTAPSHLPAISATVCLLMSALFVSTVVVPLRPNAAI
jgi:hypothetical protein